MIVKEYKRRNPKEILMDGKRVAVQTSKTKKKKKCKWLGGNSFSTIRKSTHLQRQTLRAKN